MAGLRLRPLWHLSGNAFSFLLAYARDSLQVASSYRESAVEVILGRRCKLSWAEMLEGYDPTAKMAAHLHGIGGNIVVLPRGWRAGGALA